MKTILIIDNEAQEKVLVNEALQREGYHIKTMDADSLDLETLDPSSFDLTIVNLYPDVPTTWGIYLDFKHHFPDCPVLVYMNHQALESLKSAIKNIFRKQVGTYMGDACNAQPSQKYSGGYLS